ncbi:1,4-beta-xylanase [Paenibacillus macerans]|uniref:1,4-beta-xylanase n=1 Tax=Paenibacillus macerans TaxID=44252 RepID=A0A6N8ETI8_PAEMA|nr:1,4-beta-xylanase [Paenibacillus macerans]MBS5909680.1 1,4-beta-xylanase [Paenibacillus macerans]MUG22955.1 1,4-beta-xylanase [Paenibacillus macerans]UMV47021.1 1,4-beta-xylanase [Paenibacillus macerans]GBK62635.1 1,4-beta-xylanase [Paenibacillus macerans]GBK68947.1 1,4-beta-xylanase [Paenibacillus macerans]
MNSLAPYVAGMTWGFMGVRGTWGNESAARSMETKVKSTGVNWTAIAFSALQATAFSTEIPYWKEPTVTDEEVRWAIGKAKSLGLKVCLKPIVNCADGTWRAHINFFDKDVPCEPKWADWFASYRKFIVHFAQIAEESGCEMFCIGCEMVQTNRREREWRELIGEVRKVYGGPITYNCDKYQEDNVVWWDAVDIISSSGYYPVGDWERQLNRIENVVRRLGKPFLFMEAGCPSRTGSANIPNDWTLQGAVNEAEQADYYRMMLQKCGERDWVRGFMLWDWPAQLYGREQAAADDGYCIYGKRAEAVVAEAYAAKLISP